MKVTIEEIEEDLCDLDTEYREALAKGLVDMKYLSDTPLSLKYGTDMQQQELKRVYSKPLSGKQLKDIINYISKETAISPLTYTAFSDTKTLQLFSKDKNALKKVKEHIVLLKNNKNNLSVTSLSIFNNFKGKNNGYLSICYISSEKELKADIVKIVTQK